MYCKNCGCEVKAGERFCEKCGVEISTLDVAYEKAETIKVEPPKVPDDNPITQNQVPPLAPDTNEKSEWFYLDGKEKNGPFTQTEMNQLITIKKIGNETYIWKNGMENWTFLKDTELKHGIGKIINGKQQILSNTIDLGGKNFFQDELVCYISGIIAMIGTLLPYYTIGVAGYSESINYFSRDGFFLVILVIVSLICLWIKKHQISLGFSIASVVLVLIDFTSDGGDVMAGKHDIGAYIVLIFSIILLVGSILVYIRNKNSN